MEKKKNLLLLKKKKRQYRVKSSIWKTFSFIILDNFLNFILGTV